MAGAKNKININSADEEMHLKLKDMRTMISKFIAYFTLMNCL